MLEAKRQNDTAKITKLTMDLISLLKEQQNAKSKTKQEDFILAKEILENNPAFTKALPD